MSSEKDNNIMSFRVTRKTLYAAVVIILVVGLAAGGFLGAFSGIVGLFRGAGVVARINGEEITRDEFSRALEQEKMQYLMQGIDLDSAEHSDLLKAVEQQVLNNHFIIPMLLVQKAEAEGITINGEQVEERYREYADAFGGEEQLKEQMQAMGMSRDDLDKDIARELSIQTYLTGYMAKYLEEHPEEQIDEDMEISPDAVEERYQLLRDDYKALKEMMEEEEPEVPLEELEMYLAQMKEHYGDHLEKDNFEELQPLLEEELRQEKVLQERREKEEKVVMAHIEELREESEIEIYI